MKIQKARSDSAPGWW